MSKCSIKRGAVISLAPKIKGQRSKSQVTQKSNAVCTGRYSISRRLARLHYLPRSVAALIPYENSTKALTMNIKKLGSSDILLTRAPGGHVTDGFCQLDYAYMHDIYVAVITQPRVKDSR